ncbi:MAG: UDP-N-acetylmuramate--L-alanine ligase [Flavobacteriaceae bacterium]|nr:UDP-N-acetylmuramate--L-alanine ligase [Flavobacteriaceae bacterium]
MLENYKNIYFLGIGGIGMSSLALYLINQNKAVGGYDKVKSKITDTLIKGGAIINFDDKFKTIPKSFLNKDNTLIVYTPAIPHSNNQFTFFKERGFVIIKRSELLGEISKDKFCIAIAGTHGKTTTSSILSHILFDNGLNFTSFIGGISENYNTNLIQNGSEIILVEADEFDRSFLTLNPNIACITSIDPDHLDIYENEKDLKKSFNHFKNNIKKDGFLFVNDTISMNGLTYGFKSKSDYFISNYRIVNQIVLFDINFKNSKISIQFKMPGRHNALNALVAFAIGNNLGIDSENIKKSLSTFEGVKRRFTYVLKSPKVIIDDYAHHPSEIDAVKKSVKEIYPGKKITAVFQPHLYTRTRDFMDQFAESLSDFDEIILTDIYPAREQPIDNIDSKALLKKIKNKHKLISKKSNLSSCLINSKSDVFVIMGAGDISDEVQSIKQKIELL